MFGRPGKMFTVRFGQRKWNWPRMRRRYLSRAPVDLSEGQLEGVHAPDATQPGLGGPG